LASVDEFARSFQWFHELSLIPIILPMDDMVYSCLIEYPNHFAMSARIWM
ncbi:hypothetical protein Tco_1521480, partial [Tanacetum coccineum]